MNLLLAALDPALRPVVEGRDLGPWSMAPWWASVPVALALIAVLAWYFVRLGRADVPRGRRILRRVSIVFVVGAVGALVAGLTFIHPHEDRVGFAVAWLAVSVCVIACAVLAAVDVVMTTRQGLHEYRELKKETLGGKRTERPDG